MSDAVKQDGAAGVRPARRVRPALWAAFALTLAFVFVRAFLFGSYHIETGSMEPTLHATGERVLVAYRLPFLPMRFELVVFRHAGDGDGELIVKRACGLPGENVQIIGGDLLIDGHRLPADAPRPAPVVVFDERWHALPEFFSKPRVPFEREGNAWRFDARKTAPGEPAEMHYSPRLTDDFLAADHTRVVGQVSVNDAILELELCVDEGTGTVVLRLTEEGDLFELELDIDAGRMLHANLVRRAGNEPRVVLAEADGERAPGTWHRLRFSNIDNHLRVDVDTRSNALSASYDQNVPIPPPVHDPSYLHRAPRVAIEAHGVLLHLRAVRIERDLFYTDQGRLATAAPVQLGPGQIFALGDNSAASRDSREWGPVALSDLVGVPMCVYWPPSALRGLGVAGPRPAAEVPVR